MSNEVDLEKGGGPDDGGEEEEDEAAAFEKRLYGSLWQLTALTAVGFSIGAVILYSASVTVILMCVFSIPVSGAVFYFQGQLEDSESYREILNDVRDHVNDLSEANTVLTTNNGRLEETLGPLKDTQKKLAKIAKKNGASVEKLQQLVRENARCMYETHIVMRTDIEQTLMGVVFDADQNEDGVFTEKELRRLKTRFRNIPAVVVNEKVFDKKLTRNKQVTAVLDLVCTVHDSTIPDKEKALLVDESAYEIPDDDDSY